VPGVGTERLTLVVFSGLPGSGKSAVARGVAAEIGAAYLELDRIEAPILRRLSGDGLGWAGYEILTAIADSNLSLGVSVILDAVTWTEAIRDQWRDLATRHFAAFKPIELLAPAESLHRERVAARSGAKGDWAVVSATFTLYEPWRQTRLILDPTQPLERLVADALRYVRAP